MQLAPGQRLGVYEVLSVIGAGGMGEVYRARDTTLHRDVALKVLAESVVRDADRLARFRREAQVLAALNHQNIAAIYGVEESAGTPALVLELVEGQTLADRLARGPLPLDEALPIAAQIVDALEAAHAQGIVHRDLKPANVSLRGDGAVKILDFGLAKALEDPAAPANPDLSPTITSPALTRAGFILGTAAYMSPEQARGRAADTRSDIWAFGVVLYEMLTGQRLFKGDDVADTLAAVLRAEPAWTPLPPDTPPAIRRLLRRCLEKDPRRRLQHVGDARLELADAHAVEQTPAAAPPWRAWWPLATAAIAGAALAALAAAMRTPPAPDRPVTRFSLRAPDLAPRVIGTGSSIALSPDGRTLVYVVSGTGPGLARRRLGELAAEPIRGTEGGSRPFFSPDGQSIGFFADGKLKRVAVDGGTPTVLTDAPIQSRGAWADDGSIVIVRPSLSRLPPGGGNVETIIAAADGVGQFLEAEVLPGSKTVLVHARQPPAPGHIEAVDLATGERRRLIEGSTPRLAAGNVLMFVRQGRIWGVPFDAARLTLTGTPQPLVESVGFPEGEAGESGFAIARDGTLAYIAGESSSSLVWLDRQGVATSAWPDALSLRNPRLSPDGQRAVANGGVSAADLWLFDLERGTRLRLTTDGFNRGGAWSPDGRRFAFFSAPSTPQLGGGVTQDLYAVGAGGGAPERLLDRPGPQWADSWSADGRFVVFDDGPGYSRDLWVLPIGGEPRPLVATRFNERGGQIAPDGSALAFVSDESGRDEVYVQSFPDPGAKVAVSTSGGRQPVWSRDGRTLYYREGEWMMTVAAQSAPFRASAPRRLFEMPTALYNLDPFVADYDVAADGRFLTVRRDDAAEINVVLNWDGDLRRAFGR